MNVLYEGFLNSVKKYPDRDAIICDEKIWTYVDLRNHVNGIRKKIRKRGWDKGIVAVFGEKNSLSIAGILAILLEGLAYLPIDANYPLDRINYILENSQVRYMLITSNDMVSDLRGLGEGLDFVIANEEDYADEDVQTNNVDESALAYVIYTSGSTGRPNGVMIQHKAICNTINWRMQYYDLSCDTRILQFASLSFDSSVEDIFSVLSCGGSMVIPNEKRKLNLSYIENIIVKNNVTHILMIPSLYSLLLRRKRMEWKKLRTVVVAGENVNQQLVQNHFKLNPHIGLYNEYGPTENSVCSTIAELKNGIPITIGKTISNVNAYILDDDMCKPKTGKGCLYLSGKGLAIGYINNEEATKKKFIDTALMGRIYNTGDVVEMDCEGNLIYLGRCDGEIKINGIRINLAEIENAIIKEFAEIEDCVCCLIQYRASKKIVLCLNSDWNEAEVEIINYIKKNMTKQMIPQYIYYCNAFPRLPNLKINRTELSAEIERIFEMDDMKEKVTERIYAILSKYIPEKLDENQDFIEAGVDSLTLVGILTDLENEFDMEFDLMDKNLDGNFTINYIAQKLLDENRKKLVRVN